MEYPEASDFGASTWHSATVATTFQCLGWHHHHDLIDGPEGTKLGEKRHGGYLPSLLISVYPSTPHWRWLRRPDPKLRKSRRFMTETIARSKDSALLSRLIVRATQQWGADFTWACGSTPAIAEFRLRQEQPLMP